MFPNHALRVVLWVVCLSSVVANFAVFISRLKHEIPVMRKLFSSTVSANQNTFLLNLAVADFAMGLYLLAIGLADVIFGNEYFLFALGWRKGIPCKIFGFIVFLSNVVSLLILTLVSIERFLVIVFPFGNIRLGPNLTVKLCIMSWVVGGIMALTPIILSEYVPQAFGFSDICLGLPFVPIPEMLGNEVSVISDQYGYIEDINVNNNFKGLQWVYSQIIYIYFSSACVLVITICYVCIFVSTIVAKKQSGRGYVDKAEIKLALRLSIIIWTDLICWLPVIITGILSALGTDISVDMYVWLTVLVMPVNSALNPFIYTVPTIKKKKNNEPSFIGEQRTLEKQKQDKRQKRWITTAFKAHSYESSTSPAEVSTL
ncbi:Relaxin receptor 2 [Holothuria leucospilota]|uniref:Relaxin receptor 2 n=1 Tax=Holothuria leucospilota TaxID=206669 RepID=A0A9Q1BY29_HOLLE|nr:Relaxin receptor 2 [Holothuria leucospilota]